MFWARCPRPRCGTTDALSGVDAAATLAVTGGVPPGVGTFTATCSGATDKAGNAPTSASSITYQVQFAPGRHDLPRCASPPGAAADQCRWPSVFKQKSTVPVKFRVCDANGVSIGANVVAAFNLVQVTGATATPVNEEVAVDDAGHGIPL